MDRDAAAMSREAGQTARSGRAGASVQLRPCAPRIESLEARRLLSVSLVEDINRTSPPSDPNSIVRAGGQVYFTADDGVHGRELWVTDGTEEGTRLQFETSPGTNAVGFTNFWPVGDRLFFSTANGILWVTEGTQTTFLGPFSTIGSAAALGTGLMFSNGAQLWKTDGTPEGTISFATGTSPQKLTAAANLVFFTDSDSSGTELWCSDGSGAGTRIVKDLNPGMYGSYPSLLTAVGNQLYFFTANGGVNGRNILWSSDGTSAGTKLVKTDLKAPNGSTAIASLAIDSLLYFRMDSEIWRSDGTAAGTYRLISPPAGSTLTDMTRVGSRMYMAFRAPNSDLVTYWRSDGTVATTSAFFTYNNYNFFTPAAVGNTLIFLLGRAEPYNSFRIWASDGTEAGTRELVSSAGISGLPWPPMAELNGKLLFPGYSLLTGKEIFSTDGSSVSLVKDVNAFPNRSSNPSSLVDLNGELLFFAYPEWSSIARLYSLSRAGVLSPPNIKELLAGTLSGRIVSNGALAYFSADAGGAGAEPWVTDGTAAGTRMLVDLVPGSGPSSPASIFAAEGYTLFSATTPATGRELWRTDGTATGTFMLKDFAPGTANGFIDQYNSVTFAPMARWKNLVFFFAYEGSAFKLYRTDGTSAGTFVIADAMSYEHVSAQFLAYEDRFFIMNRDQLLVTDGTVANTLNLGAFSSGLARSGQNVFFTRHTPATGSELYVTDGTLAGTRMVREIRAGTNGASIGSMVDLNGTLIFTAFDDEHALELWKSDGTEAGTVMVKDIDPGKQSGVAFNGPGLRVMGGVVIFAGQNAVSGIEPWRSDGTAEGTYALADLQPGSGSLMGTYSRYLGSFNGRLYVTYQVSYGNYASWETDGTGAGTKLTPNLQASNEFAQLGAVTYFGGYDADRGTELWQIIDDQGPVVTRSHTTATQIEIWFNERLASWPTAGDFEIRSKSTGQLITGDLLSVQADTVANKLAVTLKNLPQWANGDYTLRLRPGAAIDAASNPSSTDYTLDLFYLVGDVNHDRSVNFFDLTALAASYGKSNATWSEGDFNGDGAVNFFDLTTLSASYGSTLAEPAPAAAPVMQEAAPALASVPLAQELPPALVTSPESAPLSSATAAVRVTTIAASSVETPLAVPPPKPEIRTQQPRRKHPPSIFAHAPQIKAKTPVRSRVHRR